MDDGSMMSSLKRLTIIRTMTRGNILGQKEIVARDKEIGRAHV